MHRLSHGSHCPSATVHTLSNLFFSEIPRARHPFSHKRAPPAHDPMSYAKLHGMSLETDEEGNYRIGGIAQEGYESLYFDPAATTTAAGELWRLAVALIPLFQLPSRKKDVAARLKLFRRK